MTINRLYKLKSQKQWTPDEGGQLDQRSVGDVKLKKLHPALGTVDDEYDVGHRRKTQNRD